MEIGVLRERHPGETRVALTPEAVRRLTASGHRLFVERDAGSRAGFPDDAYVDAGALVLPDRTAVVAESRLLVKLRAPLPPDEEEAGVAGLTSQHVLVAQLAPLANPERMRTLAATGVSAFSLDAIPRTTRAQSMDVLSSMATLAGYRAVILAAAASPRLFPLLMTAAGTVRPAKVLVLGAGVAGLGDRLQARRLGAVVQAFDARPAAKEQVESLGARFLFPPRVAEGQGGYARALTPEEEEEMLRFLFDPVADADVVITTAQVPGGRAPILVTAEMVAAMRPGSVVVDLAGESGGNCAVGRPNEEVSVGGVTILTPLNLPASLPAQASELFARNLGAFLELLLQEGGLDTGDPAELCRGDDILEATLVTHGGDIVHQATRARLVTPERS